MTGTIVNALSIIVGSFLGTCIIRGVPPKTHAGVISSIGLASFLIGLKAAWNATHVLVTVVSLAAGAAIGQNIHIDDWLERAGSRIEARFSETRGSGSFGEAIVTASLMYCTGAMAIMGPLENGLTGRFDTLLAKSALDGIASIILSSALGPGVAFAAVPVLLYQGSIALLATRLQAFLTPEVVSEMNEVGGLLIAGIGLNLLNATEIKIANLTPGIGVAALLALARSAL